MCSCHLRPLPGCEAARCTLPSAGAHAPASNSARSYGTETTRALGRIWNQNAQDGIFRCKGEWPRCAHHCAFTQQAQNRQTGGSECRNYAHFSSLTALCIWNSALLLSWWSVDCPPGAHTLHTDRRHPSDNVRCIAHTRQHSSPRCHFGSY
jgi:hypothetical protein